NVFYVDVNERSACYIFSKEQGNKEKSQRRPKNRNHGCLNHFLFVVFCAIKSKKRRFHSVGKDNIHKNHPGEHYGYHAVIASFFEVICIERHEQKRKHPR